MENAVVEIYKDQGQDWRWRLRAANGKIVADSAEGYIDGTNALDAVRTAFTNFAEAVVNEQLIVVQGIEESE